jgi:hypothetical protein
LAAVVRIALQIDVFVRLAVAVIIDEIAHRVVIGSWQTAVLATVLLILVEVLITYVARFHPALAADALNKGVGKVAAIAALSAVFRIGIEISQRAGIGFIDRRVRGAVFIYSIYSACIVRVYPGGSIRYTGFAFLDDLATPRIALGHRGRVVFTVETVGVDATTPKHRRAHQWPD